MPISFHGNFNGSLSATTLMMSPSTEMVLSSMTLTSDLNVPKMESYLSKCAAGLERAIRSARLPASDKVTANAAETVDRNLDLVLSDDRVLDGSLSDGAVLELAGDSRELRELSGRGGERSHPM